MVFTTSIYSNSTSEDVKIAGNFNNWSPEKLTYDPVAKRHVFTIKEDTAKAGKYIFKFVLDSIWSLDQDYPTEFDESGNENNVVLFDHTNGKDSGSDEAANRTNKKVQDDIANEPVTPDPTPYDLSKQSTISQSNVPQQTTDFSNSTPTPTQASKTVESTPVSDAPPPSTTTSAPDRNLSNIVTSDEIITALKNTPLEPKTRANAESDKSFIKSTEATHHELGTDIKPSTSIDPENVHNQSRTAPDPQPVSRPEYPTETASVEPGKPLSQPEPVYRPEVETINGDDVDTDDIAEFDETETTNVNPQDGKTVTQHQTDALTHVNDDGHYGFGFFAAMLHIITRFFSNWFGRG